MNTKISNPLVSIVIPCYEMGGYGEEFLDFGLSKIEEQTFKNFEVIISDDSNDNKIKDLCSKYIDRINIKYFKNKTPKGMSSNLNNGILYSTGKIIKVLCQDDFFALPVSLEITLNNFDTNRGWLASAYIHTDKNRNPLRKIQIPSFNMNLYLINTIGTPSCLSFLNNKKEPILFDTSLTWYMDCDYYYRLYLKYGLPTIVNIITIAQVLWEGQSTETIITQELIGKEKEYLLKKYGKA